MLEFSQVLNLKRIFFLFQSLSPSPHENMNLNKSGKQKLVRPIEIKGIFLQVPEKDYQFTFQKALTQKIITSENIEKLAPLKTVLWTPTLKPLLRVRVPGLRETHLQHLLIRCLRALEPSESQGSSLYNLKHFIMLFMTAQKTHQNSLAVKCINPVSQYQIKMKLIFNSYQDNTH